MDMALTTCICSRFLCFICALASLTRLTLSCSQDFLDVIGPGTRVKRGDDWKWGDQDSNGLGTVTTEISSSSWITVKWDNGHTNSYRVGHQSKCDLALVDVLETQCNFFPTNMTNTGDFLLSFQDFPRPVHSHYRCHKHIQSPEEDKVVALHVLMIDMCNTTIYDGTNKSARLIEKGCALVPGTYVSSGPDMFIDTFKKLGVNYGFVAYVTYEEKECGGKKNIYAEKDKSGFFTSPYSNYTLGSPIYCTWDIRASSDQIIELTVTFHDNERRLYVREEHKGVVTTIGFASKKVGNFKSETSLITLTYEKNNQISKGFTVVYKTKDKPADAYCPQKVITIDHGETGLLKLPTYDLNIQGTLRCQWKFKAKGRYYIGVTATRMDAVKCRFHEDILTMNGAFFPRKDGCVNDSFHIGGTEINLIYTANKPNNNSVIVLQYKYNTLPFCFSSGSVSVKQEKAFLDTPDPSSGKQTLCQWNLYSPEHSKVSVEVLTEAESDWEAYKAFRYSENHQWFNMTEGKITSSSNKLHLRLDIWKIPSDFKHKVIVTHKAVLDTLPVPMTPTPKPPPTPTKTLRMPTPSPRMLTPTMTHLTTPISMFLQTTNSQSTQPGVECTQPGVPIWCYVVLVLLSIACVALFMTSVTLYRRQIYVCDEHGSLLNLRLQDIIAKDDHI